jgi:hypothetical protein
MADPTPAAPATDTAAAAIVSKPISPGWKTTELYLTTLLLAGLGTVIEQLVQMIPSIAANPSLPPWAAPLLALAPVLLGYVAKQVATHYTEQRTALKLATTPPATDSAAAAALNKAIGAGLVLVLVASALLPLPARAQVLEHDEDCAALVDAGVPLTPAFKMPAGTVTSEPLWALTPRSMCAAGATQQTCQAEQQATPVLVYVAIAALGVLAGGAIAVGAASASGHLR